MFPTAPNDAASSPCLYHVTASSAASTRRVFATQTQTMTIASAQCSQQHRITPPHPTHRPHYRTPQSKQMDAQMRMGKPNPLGYLTRDGKLRDARLCNFLMRVPTRHSSCFLVFNTHEHYHHHLIHVNQQYTHPL
jgi:hypothetical protein